MRKNMNEILKLFFMLVMICMLVGNQYVFVKAAAEDATGKFNKNYTLTGKQVDDIVTIAKAQAGMTQSQLGYQQAWCASFVSYCAKLAGCDDIIGSDKTAKGIKDYILNNKTGKEVTSPQKGDLVLYRCPYGCDEELDGYVHIALMTSATTSIHGNYDGRVVDNVAPTSYTDKGGHHGYCQRTV